MYFKSRFPPGRALYLNVAFTELPQRKENTSQTMHGLGKSNGLPVKQHKESYLLSKHPRYWSSKGSLGIGVPLVYAGVARMLAPLRFLR